jgi:hypothetical protein
VKKADLRGRHDLGAIVGYGYRIYLRNFTPLFLIALLVLPVEMLGGVLLGPPKAGDASAPTMLFQLAVAAVAAVAMSGCVFAVNEVATGSAPSFGTSLDTVFERITALFGTLLLGTALAAGALYAFPFVALYWLFHRDVTLDGRRQWWIVLVPFALAFYLVVRWSMMQQAVMIDGKRSWSALDASADAVRGNWWRVARTLLIVGLIASGPLLVTGSAALLPDLGYATITGLALALGLPFQAAAQTLLYYDLKARKQAPTDVSPDRLPAP